MIFDDLHDPDPPSPGMSELASIAERAQEIRRERNRRLLRWACAVVIAVGGVAIATVPWGRPSAPLQPPGVTVPTTTPPTTDEDAARSTTTVGAIPSPATNEAVPLTDAGRLEGIPPVRLDGATQFAFANGSIELEQTSDGRLCGRLLDDDAQRTCTAPGVSLYALPLSSAGASDPSRTVIAVDATVAVNFLTVDAACSAAFRPAVEVDVDVWLCDGLDADRATAVVRRDGLVAIVAEFDP